MIAIIDYGMGNLRSVHKALQRLNIESIITRNVKEIQSADKLILPGVGHFGNGMRKLKDYNLLDILNQKVLKDKTPILGICLGMQLFGNSSEEGNIKGLGWLNAISVKFNIKDKLKYKIPHMGWNSIEIKNKNPLLSGIANYDEFYFVHSYHMMCENSGDILTTTDYEYVFVSSLQHENIFGTQFHPEKSHKKGLQILENFALKV